MGTGNKYGTTLFLLSVRRRVSLGQQKNIIMINFIKTLFGVEATSKNIRGKKSNGCEDDYGYKNWKKENCNSCYDAVN